MHALQAIMKAYSDPDSGFYQFLNRLFLLRKGAFIRGDISLARRLHAY